MPVRRDQFAHAVLKIFQSLPGSRNFKFTSYPLLSVYGTTLIVDINADTHRTPARNVYVIHSFNYRYSFPRKNSWANKMPRIS